MACPGPVATWWGASSADLDGARGTLHGRGGRAASLGAGTERAPGEAVLYVAEHGQITTGESPGQPVLARGQSQAW